MELKKKDIYQLMLSTRKGKYVWFIRCLRAYKYLSLNFIKGDLLESYYILMRYIDDIVDGDIELPPKYKSRAEFIKKRIDFLTNKEKAKESADQLMQYCFNLAKRVGMDIQESTHDILKSLLFDAERIGKQKIFTQKDLDEHYYQLDTRGTVKPSLVFFGEDPESYKLLKSISRATRIHYNLRDLEEDIRAGFINISKEDIQKYNLDVDRLDVANKNLEAWIKDQAKMGIKLIKEFDKVVKDKKFNRKKLLKLTLHFIYKKPAINYFTKIISIYN